MLQNQNLSLCAIPATSKDKVRFVAVNFHSERVVASLQNPGTIWFVGAESLFDNEPCDGMQQLGIYL